MTKRFITLVLSLKGEQDQFNPDKYVVDKTAYLTLLGLAQSMSEGETGAETLARSLMDRNPDRDIRCIQAKRIQISDREWAFIALVIGPFRIEPKTGVFKHPDLDDPANLAIITRVNGGLWHCMAAAPAGHDSVRTLYEHNVNVEWMHAPVVEEWTCPGVSSVQS